MTTYIVTDSDWEWTDNEDGSACPFIVEADTPEEAVKAAVAQWETEDQLDGLHAKVAVIDTIGFYGCNRPEAGAHLEWDEKFQHLDETPAAELELIRSKLRDIHKTINGNGHFGASMATVMLAGLIDDHANLPE